jgi:hypothetical protein
MGIAMNKVYKGDPEYVMRAQVRPDPSFLARPSGRFTEPHVTHILSVAGKAERAASYSGEHNYKKPESLEATILRKSCVHQQLARSILSFRVRKPWNGKYDNPGKDTCPD